MFQQVQYYYLNGFLALAKTEVSYRKL